MNKYYLIVDCFTDEPAGLGVPPYIGTYPRYLAGALAKEHGAENVKYFTIDDLRLKFLFKDHKKEGQQTNILAKNLSKNYKHIQNILSNSEQAIVVAGLHTPGKYLSAQPGTMHELKLILPELASQTGKCKTILTGPASEPGLGSRSEGGKISEPIPKGLFHEIDHNYLGINDYEKVAEFAIKGAFICSQHPDFSIIPAQNFVMAEIETGRGCSSGKCSFCTEPLKSKVGFREQIDILAEVKALHDFGIKNFRLGKQTCFYSYKFGKSEEIKKLLKPISELKPDVLHIDNASPRMVTEETTKLIVEYCTSGNIAAFGVESFDPAVIKANNLNTTPEEVTNAIKIINKYGKTRGENGMPIFLPGINIIFGLIGESKKTYEENMHNLKAILDHDLWLRRINIRQVAVFPGTALSKESCGGMKFLKKNKKYYWKWKNDIRQNIDFPMLKKVIPEGTILRNLRTEIHDGHNTFCRQIGTYPIIVGIKQKLFLNQTINARIKGHMLRSVVGELIQN